MANELLILKVDKSNQILVDVPEAALAAAGVSAMQCTTVASSKGASPGHLRVKIGAAGARYLLHQVGVRENSLAWPSTLPEPAATLVARALPEAERRVRALRAAGTQVPATLYSDDLARAGNEDVVAVNHRFRASAQSSHDYRPGA